MPISQSKKLSIAQPESHLRKPDWLKIKLGANSISYGQTRDIIQGHSLHTICASGKCPNQGECWTRGTASFMIGGDICTRHCRFCNTKSGKPFPLDPLEPENIAKSIFSMHLKHAVITSVDRDDLPDGGSIHWQKNLEAIHRLTPSVSCEALIPDFRGDKKAIDRIIAGGADIISHNMETVRRLTPSVRNVATYEGSLEVLRYVASRGVISKTGLMLGLGETYEEVLELFEDVVATGTTILTIGQYLRPTRNHLPVVAYISPSQFDEYKILALKKGFKYVESGPLVRSSYHAEEHLEGIKSIQRTHTLPPKKREIVLSELGK